MTHFPSLFMNVESYLGFVHISLMLTRSITPMPKPICLRKFAAHCRTARLSSRKPAQKNGGHSRTKRIVPLKQGMKFMAPSGLLSLVILSSSSQIDGLLTYGTGSEMRIQISTKRQGISLECQKRLWHLVNLSVL
jgi:hypothetical protein